MTKFADVEKFITEARRASTPKALDGLLASISNEMGFDHYALIHHVDLAPMSPHLTHMEDGSLVALTNYPQAWVDHYIAHNFVERDPVVLASHRTNVGFTWEEISKLIRVHRPSAKYATQVPGRV